MGIFDFLKSDKKKAHEAAEKAAEQREQQPQAGSAGTGSMGGKYTDAAAGTNAAGERMAAAAPPKPPQAPSMPPAGHIQHKTPTPGSAAHKAVPSAPTPKPAGRAQRMYTVKAGDSLSAIARRELGNEGRWRELYAMNKTVIGPNPDLIRPGMVLSLPG